MLCPPSAAQEIRFTDVTIAAGLTRRHTDWGPLMGAGASFLDHDGDGRPDLLFTGSFDGPWLYRNRGDGTFEDVTAAAGLGQGVSPRGLAACVGDPDNDGDDDVYLVADGPNQFFRNEGDGTFRDVTRDVGLDDDAFGSGAAFGDYDGDGHLDLYLANYIRVPQFPYHIPEPNRLFRNNGDGTFRDVTAACGVAGAGCTLAVSFSDYDGDGDVDLWVGNDFGEWVEPNLLYRNDGPGATGDAWNFTEVGAEAGARPAIYCMGTAAGDIDRDLDLDYAFTNLGRNVLLRNDGQGRFQDITSESGTEGTYDPYTPTLFATSWGEGFHDFDGDGWLDLWVTNGYIPAAPFLANSRDTPNFLFRNRGEGGCQFDSVGLAAGIEDRQIGRGAAFADFDGDGDVDVAIGNIEGTPVLFRNDSPGEHHWLRAHLTGRRSNRDGAGTRLIAEVGDFALLREASRNYSFESSSEATVTFGLGRAKRVHWLRLRWPSGIRQNLRAPPIDHEQEVVEPLVTVHASTTAPDHAEPGRELELVLWAENHAGAAMPVECELSLEYRGQRTDRTYPARRMLPGLHELVRTTLRLPPHARRGSVQVTWTVCDAGGGVDAWSQEVRIRP